MKLAPDEFAQSRLLSVGTSTLSEHSVKYMQKKFYKTESEFKEACYMCMVPYKTEEDPLVNVLLW